MGFKMEINLSSDDITKFHSHPLYPAFAELKSASDAVKEMETISVGNFHLFELAWQKFLQAIERCWKKLQFSCHGRKGWQTLESKIINKRKKDQLLNYLTQARNATEHSISPVIKEWDANLTVTPLNGGMQLNWEPYDRPLLEITNRGRVFYPPKEHLGKPMAFYRAQYKSQPEPIVAAILAMNFYVEWLNKVSKQLFSQDKQR